MGEYLPGLSYQKVFAKTHIKCHSLNWVIIESSSLPEVLPSQLLPFLIALTVIAFMTQATEFCRNSLFKIKL